MLIRSFNLLMALALALLAPGVSRALAGGADHTPEHVVAGYTVTLAFASEPVQTGANEVVVSIRTADGAPVPDAAVTVAVMAYTAEAGHDAAAADSHDAAPADTHGDSHDAAPADTHGDSHDAAPAEDHAHASIPTRLEADPARGISYGTLHLDQEGRATVMVAFTIAGLEHTTDFEVEVVQARPRALVLGGFAVVNGLVIIAAALLKRHLPQKQRRTAAAPPATMIALTALPATSEEERPA